MRFTETLYASCTDFGVHRAGLKPWALRLVCSFGQGLPELCLSFPAYRMETIGAGGATIRIQQDDAQHLIRTL